MNALKTKGALAALALALGACGSQYRSAFSHHFLDNQELDLAAVLERLPEPAHDDRPQNALGAPIAVAATHVEDGGARQVVAWRLDRGERLWAVEVDAATQPEILGDVVFLSTREQLQAYDLASGRPLWQYRLPDLAYVGATRNGDTIFWSATVGALGGARRVGHIVAVDARSGAERWRHEVQGVFGQPAASGGYVFVPWERQNIAILDAATGDELARLRSTDDVVAWAFDHPTGIYYGGRSIYRLTHRSHSGTRAESTHVRPALGELPRQPESIWPDGYVPRPGARSARGRIRVYFNPAPAPDADSIHVEGDTYYFVYFRYVFAYSLDGVLRWARILEQDVANAEAMPHGLLTVGEQGRAVLLDRDSGNDRWTWDAGVAIASVGIDASGFDPAGDGGPARPLRQLLNEVVLDPDNRLVAARGYAIARLAELEEPEITRDLLDLYQQRAMPGALREAIRQALRTRRSGQPYLVEALARRYDFLQETESPPLEAIVPALLAMRHTESVPQLVNHLMNHETPAEVLPDLVDAIVQLGGADAVPALRRFLVLYRQDSLFAGPTEDRASSEGGQVERANPGARALALAARGIFEHGGPAGRELLASLSAERAPVHPPLREHIAGLYEAEQAAAERAEREEEAARQAALAAASAQAEAALPPRLSQEQVNATFHENADQLRECIADELERNERLAQVRVVFILENDGRASEVTVAPRSDELSRCLGERVAQIQFPRFRQRRMRATFVVSVRGGADAEATDTTQPALASRAPEGAPWFWYEQERARLRGVADQVPAVAAWWAERQPPAAATATAGSAVDTVECPPGMPEQVCRQRQAAAASGGAGGTASAGTSGGPAGAGTAGGAGGGTSGTATASAGGTAGTAGSGTSGSGTSGSGTSGSGTSGSGTSGSGTSGSSGGTPWWATASSDEDE
ncbi:MAG: PQQ-binding-like beta-propeller repeat protein [Sandaracinaceae bacterium]|nr:PQQ-binding-like beta-propeller repeat protein [Sandaracinaceae bacterium]